MEETRLRVISGEAQQGSPPGTEIHDMAERQDEIIARVITEKVVNKQTAASDLSALYGMLDGLAKKTVMVVFALGKILTFVKQELPHGEFGDFITKNCPFGEASARNYIRIYKHYKDLPRRQIEELTLGRAYVDAGIKKLAAPPKQGESADAEAAGDKDAVDFGLPKIEEFDRVLKTQPVSGVPLERYRVAALEDGKIYGIHEALGVYPVANIYLPRHLDKPEARLAFEQVHKDICIALEIYYSKIEQLEDTGILPKPEDHRFTVALRKSRGIAEQPEPATAQNKQAKKRTNRRRTK